MRILENHLRLQRHKSLTMQESTFQCQQVTALHPPIMLTIITTNNNNNSINEILLKIVMGDQIIVDTVGIIIKIGIMHIKISIAETLIFHQQVFQDSRRHRRNQYRFHRRCRSHHCLILHRNTFLHRRCHLMLEATIYPLVINPFPKILYT